MTGELSSPNPEQQPSPEEIEQAAAILSRLKPGLLPKELFHEITRLWVTSIVEVVPCRVNGQGQTEVLLFRRPDDDPNWPGMYHTPGTVVRPTDIEQGVEGAIQRIATDEFHLEGLPPTRLVDIEFHQVARGPEMAQIYISDLTGIETSEGVWCNADELPDTVVDTQRGFIDNAVQNFNKEQ